MLSFLAGLLPAGPCFWLFGVDADTNGILNGQYLDWVQVTRSP